MAMRKAWLLALFLPVAALSAGLTINPDVQVSLTNCAADGSTTATVKRGEYLVTTAGEDLWFCYAATCAASGVYLPSGAAVVISIKSDTSVSCRSAGATGDLQYTRAN